MDFLDEGMQTLERRASLARLSIYLYLMLSLAELGGELAEVAGVVDLNDGSATSFSVALVYLAGALSYLLSVVMICMWIHRAHANLFSAGLDGLEFTPGWSVGWFFVPIASLFKPFQAMRELWNASNGLHDGYSQPAPGLLSVWWGCFIGGGILGNISFRLDMSGDTAADQVGTLIAAISSALMIAGAWLLLRIIDSVTQAERSRLHIGSTFA